MYLLKMSGEKVIPKMICKSDGFGSKFNLFYHDFIDLVKRKYVLLWHNMSLDKRVRTSPYDDPPDNEIKMTTAAKMYVRFHRIGISFIHVYGLIGLYNCIRGEAKMQTILFTMVLSVLSQLGIVCGAHRLWCHNSFKANGPVRFFLMICQTLPLQYSIFFWSQTHRLHHKFSDTPLDPHDRNKGFFFSHVGWLLIQRSPEVKNELQKIYTDDLRKDKIVMFQHKTIGATDNRIVQLLSLGDEGWHNYHHAFPWDYRVSEFWGYDGGISLDYMEEQQFSCFLLVESLSTMNVFGLIHSVYKYFIHYAKRFYIIFWHELSLDKRVRASPFVPPPEDEIKMTFKQKFYFRSHRVSLLLLHVLASMGLYYSLSGRVYIQTTILGMILMVMSEIGVVCAAHRYWAHHSFKAKLPLEIFLMLCQTLTSQYSVLYWVRVHRVHHKFSDTPRDPHNANAGLFFSHIGWILIQRSPEVSEELKKIYVEDLKRDKLVMFQHRYYIPLTILVCYTIPAMIPWYFWNENFFMGLCVPVSLRFVLILHLSGLTNSLAHMRGKKPFDKNIQPGDSWLAWFLSFGDEGWHNYHHVFPWDYKASDYWGYKGGISSNLLEFFAVMGWAYDLKTTSAAVTIKRRLRTGDLSSVWGWDDTNIDLVYPALT